MHRCAERDTKASLKSQIHNYRLRLITFSVKPCGSSCFHGVETDGGESSILSSDWSDSVGEFSRL